MMKLKQAVGQLLLFACGTSTAAHAENGFQEDVLRAHNLERRAFQTAPLAWDAHLAAAADSYALELARTDRWSHSPSNRRVGQGENLWTGTRAAFGLADMVGGWTSERRFFRSGVFPDVSRSGSWHDVGHYTQIVWPTTTRVGCGLRASAQRDYLVCRYSSPGNIIGGRLGSTQVAIR